VSLHYLVKYLALIRLKLTNVPFYAPRWISPVRESPGNYLM